MPTFIYTAKKDPKETTQGIVVAEDQKKAIEKVISLGLSPISIEPLTSSAEQKKAARRFSLFPGRRLVASDLDIFTSQLKSLINAKVDLLKSLNMIYAQADRSVLKDLVLEMHTEVKNGLAFSDALARHRNFFPSYYINLVKIGEASGRLDSILEEIDGFLSKDREFKMHIKTAMAYPILMLSVGTIVIFILFSYVIPKLTAIFADFDYELPIPTQIMLGISNFLSIWWWVIIVFLLGLAGLIYKMSKTASGRFRLDWFKLHIPVVSDLIFKESLARFCRTLSLLIRSGLPVLQAVQASIITFENAVQLKKLEIISKEVVGGAPLASAMKKVALFPVLLIQMVAVGEEGGRLEGMLDEAANIYTQQTNMKIKIITALLEPVVILILGLILGGIVLAMLLPIFQLNLVVR